MNSLKPNISYTELLAAKNHISIIINQQNDLVKKIEYGEQESIEIDNLTKLFEIEDKIDKFFLQQIQQIEFQIDINYPLT